MNRHEIRQILCANCERTNEKRSYVHKAGYNIHRWLAAFNSVSYFLYFLCISLFFSSQIFFPKYFSLRTLFHWLQTAKNPIFYYISLFPFFGAFDSTKWVQRSALYVLYSLCNFICMPGWYELWASECLWICVA